MVAGAAQPLHRRDGARQDDRQGRPAREAQGAARRVRAQGAGQRGCRSGGRGAMRARLMRDGASRACRAPYRAAARRPCAGNEPCLRIGRARAAVPRRSTATGRRASKASRASPRCDSRSIPTTPACAARIVRGGARRQAPAAQLAGDIDDEGMLTPRRIGGRPQPSAASGRRPAARLVRQGIPGRLARCRRRQHPCLHAEQDRQLQ